MLLEVVKLKYRTLRENLKAKVGNCLYVLLVLTNQSIGL
jgi:hypothetical protein